LLVDTSDGLNVSYTSVTFSTPTAMTDLTINGIFSDLAYPVTRPTNVALDRVRSLKDFLAYDNLSVENSLLNSEGLDTHIPKVLNDDNIGFMQPYEFKNPLGVNADIGNVLTSGDEQEDYDGSGNLYDMSEKHFGIPIIGGNYYYHRVTIRNSGTLPTSLFNDTNETYPFYTTGTHEVMWFDIGDWDGYIEDGDDYRLGSSNVSCEGRMRLEFDTTYGGRFPNGRDMHIVMPKGYYGIRIRGTKSQIKVYGKGRVFFYLRTGNVIWNTTGDAKNFWPFSDGHSQGFEVGTVEGNPSNSAAGSEGSATPQTISQLYFLYLTGDNSIGLNADRENLLGTEIKFLNIRVQSFVVMPNIKRNYVRMESDRSDGNPFFYSGGIVCNGIDFVNSGSGLEYVFFRRNADLSNVWYYRYGSSKNGTSAINPIQRPIDAESDNGNSKWKIISYS
jgi:hypothetical protein